MSIPLQYIDIKATWETGNIPVHLRTANWTIAIVKRNNVETRNIKCLGEGSLPEERKSMSGVGRCSMSDISGSYWRATVEQYATAEHDNK